jgi:hypothetical protein
MADKNEQGLIFVSEDGKVVPEGSDKSRYQLSGKEADDFLAKQKVGKETKSDADDGDADESEEKAKEPTANKARQSAAKK